LTNSFKFWSLAISLKQSPGHGVSDQFGDFAGNECQQKYDILRGADWPDWNLFVSYNYDIDKVAKHVKIKPSTCHEIRPYYGWHENTNDLFNFDVDNNYFDRYKFLSTMEQLYDWIGFNDFNPILINQYYTKYILLHYKDGKNGQTL